MRESLKIKALAVLERYSQGGNIRQSCEAEGMAGGDFYAVVSEDVEINNKYEHIRRNRGHMMIDNAEESITCEGDPKLLRAKIDSWVKLAGALNPERYGQRVNMQLTQTVDLAGAIEAAKLRALRPRCDLEMIPYATFAEISDGCDDRPPDSQSATRPAPVVDPFEE